MEIKLITRDIEATDGLREYIEKRLSGLDKYSSHIIDAELILDEQRGRFLGELVVKVKGSTLTAKSQAKDPFSAIDELKDKMKSQLVKYEDKLKYHRA
ncbi:MAG: ribosome-associated translation inhibitor RaiA [Candidatus Hydrothermae bacterium]|nr:ribosome-associated translation inhibitor RaiA [Candidatus Hydrothermae bacterium]